MINATEMLSPSRLYSYSVEMLPGAITAPIITPMPIKGKKSGGKSIREAKARTAPAAIITNEGVSALILKLRFTIHVFILYHLSEKGLGKIVQN